MTKTIALRRGVHKLAANVETLALQIKMLTEKLESNITRLENGLRTQDERIGILEKEPGQKWKALVTQITGLIVAAVIAKFIN